MVEFYNFKVHQDIYFLMSSIIGKDYNYLFHFFGEMDINEFKTWFDKFTSDIRKGVIANNAFVKSIVRYIILTYRDRVCTFAELQEKVCEMSNYRFLVMYDKTIKDLKTKIYQL